MKQLLGADELEEVFHIIDFDGSGEIDIEEFFETISKVVLGNLTLNDLRHQRQLSATTNQLREHIEKLEDKIDGLEKKLDARFGL